MGLNTSGAAGVQMADVTVDIETGVVKINRFVAVQDCGLVINPKLAESQVYGAIIMGICTALFEERVMDEQTGRMLNPDMEFYKLAGIARYRRDRGPHGHPRRRTTSAASSASANRRPSAASPPSPTRSPTPSACACRICR